MKVLLVDDEQIALDYLEVLLNKIGGMEVVGKFTDGKKLLQDIADYNVDLIFLDMQMGDIHGLEVAEQLAERYPQINVVFVTASSQYALEAFEVSATDYLLKPVTVERLKKTLAKIETKRIRYGEQTKGNNDIYIQALGAFSLYNGAKEVVRWRTKKVRELFTYLWHHQGNVVYKVKLIEDLWPDFDVEKATTHLHTTVYQLRKLLTGIGLEHPISSGNEQYALKVTIDSDVKELEKELKKHVYDYEAIDKMMTLYNGDYLELDDYDWASSYQTELRSKYIKALETFILQEEEHGNLTEVGPIIETLVALEPYNGMYIEKLLDFYGNSKNTEKMITTYEKFTETWTKDLGLDLPYEVTRTYNHYLQKYKQGMKHR